MVKYWNKQRIERVRARRRRKEEEQSRAFREERAASKRRKPGTPLEQAELVFDALATSIRRQMLRRLRKGGAMSVSHLVKPFRITLPGALKHVLLLERSGLITTHKRGRIRFCVYEPKGFEQLIKYLHSKEAFKE